MTAQEIKTLRKELGRTQTELAKMVGASLITVGRWERAETKPLPVYVEKLLTLQRMVNKEGRVK